MPPAEVVKGRVGRVSSPPAVWLLCGRACPAGVVPAVAEQDFACRFDRDSGLVGVNRQERAALMDAILVEVRVFVADAVLGQETRQAAGNRTGTGAEGGGSGNRGRRDRAGRGERSDAGDRKRGNAEQGTADR